MKYFYFFLVILFVYLATEYYLFSSKLKISSEIAKNTKKFENISTDFSKTILVIGDSTAYGVGNTNSNNSIPGKFFVHENASYLENNSISGAKINDLNNQITNAKLDKYNIILVQIGGNDIVGFKSVDVAKEEWANVLNTLPKYDRLIVISAGNVGGAPILPWFVKSYYTNLNLKYHDMFSNSLIENKNAKYINMYEDPKTDLFILKPEIYFAPDGFHPSDAGYKIWFDKIIKE